MAHLQTLWIGWRLGLPNELRRDCRVSLHRRGDGQLYSSATTRVDPLIALRYE
jgi:hypothetical protein